MRQAIALWHAGRELGQQTLLALGSCAEGEASFDLPALGIPILEASQIDRDSEGIVRIEPMQRRIAAIKDRQAAKAIDSLLRQFEPHVLHSHTSKAGWLGRKAGQRAAVPVIAHTFHGHVLRDYFPALFSAMLKRRERSLARISDLLFAVSESCAGELNALGVADHIEFLRPAVDCRALGTAGARAARQLMAVGDGALLGFVGRLVPVKAPLRFLDLLQAMPEAEGVVFGSGPLEPRCRAHPAGNRVRWMGSKTDLGRYLPGIDVLVMPSLREGFPVAGIEAAACGVPTAGFDVPGVRDLLAAADGSIGIPENAGLPGLVARVRELLDLPRQKRVPSRRDSLLEACRPERIAAMLEARYQGILARPKQGRGSC